MFLPLLIICLDFLSASDVTEQVLTIYMSAKDEKSTISNPASSSFDEIQSDS